MQSFLLLRRPEGSHILHPDSMAPFCRLPVNSSEEERGKRAVMNGILGKKKKKKKQCISRSRLHSHPLIQLSLMYALWLISYKAPYTLLQLFRSFLCLLFFFFFFFFNFSFFFPSIPRTASSRRKRSGSGKAILFRL